LTLIKAEKPRHTSFSTRLTPGPLAQIVFLLPADPPWTPQLALPAGDGAGNGSTGIWVLF